MMSFEDIDLQWFAAEDEGRTEEPSELKIERARKEGRVAKSQDLNSSLVFLFAVLTLILLGKFIFQSCAEILIFFFERVLSKEVMNSSLGFAFINYLLKIVLPIAVVGIVVCVISNIVQNKGMIFSLKPITPNFSKIIPKFGEYFKNTLFSFKGAFNIIKSIGKVLIIIIIAYIMLRRDIPVLLMVIRNGQILVAIGKMAVMVAQILVIVAVIFLIIAIPDYFVNKKEFIESMKMTKQEVKQEYKEMEGDPEIKSRLSQAQKQLLQMNIPKAVQESDVVITNPTHFAVSLKYDKDVADSPKVMAKGADEIAFQMRKIATDNQIPIVENRPLAR
nr:EscU/YscU/HrcU family type III secretion system export apparatus switch protein [Treponema sp.]